MHKVQGKLDEKHGDGGQITDARETVNRSSGHSRGRVTLLSHSSTCSDTLPSV